MICAPPTPGREALDECLIIAVTKRVVAFEAEYRWGFCILNVFLFFWRCSVYSAKTWSAVISRHLRSTLGRKHRWKVAAGFVRVGGLLGFLRPWHFLPGQ